MKLIFCIHLETICASTLHRTIPLYDAFINITCKKYIIIV